jgi:two-component system, NarL family, sensor kinase
MGPLPHDDHVPGYSGVPSTLMDEPGLRLPGVVALAVLPLVVALGWLTLTRVGTPSDGTITGRTSSGWHADGIVVDEVYAAGSLLRPGDVVVSLNGVGVDRLAQGRRALSPQVGDVLTYRVERAGSPGGAVQSLDLPVRLTRYPLAAGIRAHWAVLPLAVTMYAVATFVVVRRPRQPAARALYAITALLPVTGTNFPLGAQVLEVVAGPLWPYVVGDLANCLVWGGLLHFALVFPERPAFMARWRGLVAATYLSPFALHAVRLMLSLPAVPEALPRLQILTLVSQPAAHVQPFVVGIALMAGYRRQHGDDLARRRMQWAFVAFATAAVAYIGLG